MSNFEMWQGDTAPPLTIEVTELGQPLDLSEAASVGVAGFLDGEEKFFRTGELIAPSRVQMSWASDDTDTIGSIYTFVRITWPDTTIQTVETDNHVVVRRLP